jgi:thiamine biosynthesis lipoprotein ApbE
MTVVGPGIVEADVYATATFVMGLAGLDFIERRAGYEAYAIDPDLRGHWTTGFDDHCEQRP